MSKKGLRSIIQANFMFIVIGLAVMTGWACDCGYGSDNPSELIRSSRDIQTSAQGVLERWHDFESPAFTATTKDLDFFRSWVQEDQAAIGILIPTAPGASQPGSLGSKNPMIIARFDANGNNGFVTVPFTQNLTVAAQLTTLFPPPAGSVWYAISPENYDWLTLIPTQTAEIKLNFGSLFYPVDFHGADPCNHCEIKLVGCSESEFSFSEQALLRTFLGDEIAQNQELTCNHPVSTYVFLHDDSGHAPGPVIAAFGLYGGTAYQTSYGGSLEIPYALHHTASTAQTLQLAPIHSNLGFTYTWQDMNGNPIDQLALDPATDDLFTDTLKVVATNLPTCARLQDTLYLTATLAMTPSIQATTQTPIQIVPDPTKCQVADLGIAQKLNADALQAGQSLDVTLVITNYESTAKDATVTVTLSPIQAIGAVKLPAGCAQNGATVNCTLTALAPKEGYSLVMEVTSSSTFCGIMSSYAVVEPIGYKEFSFYDNSSGPAPVNITGCQAFRLLFMPLIKR